VQKVRSQQNVSSPPAQTIPSPSISQTAPSIQSLQYRKALKKFRKQCKRQGMSLADFVALVSADWEEDSDSNEEEEEEKDLN